MQLITFTTVVAAVAMTAPTTNAMEKFLQQIPNGSLFGKWLGHTADAYTDFGNDFVGAGSWTESLCKRPFTGAKTAMTYGEAFGDPCCTWKAGAKAQTITAWKQGGSPTTKTVCASSPTVAPSPVTKAPTPANPATKAPTPATKAPTPATKAPTPGSTPKKPSPKPKPGCKKTYRK